MSPFCCVVFNPGFASAVMFVFVVLFINCVYRTVYCLVRLINLENRTVLQYYSF